MIPRIRDECHERVHDARAALAPVGSFLADAHPELFISKKSMGKVQSIECVRLKRETARQNLGFSSRPFVLCGLPVRKPPDGQLVYERRNGKFVLQITGHPEFGVPYGQDRIVPIFLATLAVRQKRQTIRFKTAAEMLETFGMHQRSTGAWWPPSSGSSAPPCSSART